MCNNWSPETDYMYVLEQTEIEKQKQYEKLKIIYEYEELTDLLYMIAKTLLIKVSRLQKEVNELKETKKVNNVTTQ